MFYVSEVDFRGRVFSRPLIPALLLIKGSKGNSLDVFAEEFQIEGAQVPCEPLSTLSLLGSSRHGSAETNLTSICEDAGSIPGVAQ